MDILKRNNVHVQGDGDAVLFYAGVIKSEGNRRKITQSLNAPNISPNRHWL